MIVPRPAVDVLFESGERAERLYPAALEVVLPLGDVARVVGDGVRDVVARHGGHAEDGDRTRALEVHRLFVARGQTAVKVAGVAAVGRDLFHGYGRFLLRVGEVGHVGEQHEHALAVQSETLRDREREIGDERAFHGGVGRRVHEHHGMPHRAALFQRVLEEQEVVVFQTHAAQHDDVHLRLHGYAREQLVVRLARNGEYGELLALHERVEHVYHGDARAYHVARDDPARGVDGRPADGYHVLGERGAVVPGDARAGKDAAEQVFGIGHRHGLAQEPDGVGGADALRARKDLQEHEVVVQLDDVRVAVAHERQIPVAHAARPHGHDVAHYRFDLGVNLLHIVNPPVRPMS